MWGDPCGGSSRAGSTSDGVRMIMFSITGNLSDERSEERGRGIARSLTFPCSPLDPRRGESSSFLTLSVRSSLTYIKTVVVQISQACRSGAFFWGYPHPCFCPCRGGKYVYVDSTPHIL